MGQIGVNRAFPGNSISLPQKGEGAVLKYHFISSVEVVRLEVCKALMRFLSYLFHGLLCLILLAMSALAMAGGAATVNLGMIAWTGATTTWILFVCALVGLISVLLAFRGIMRPLFFLWSLVVFIVLVKGYFLSSYHFSPGDVSTALYLIAGSLIALLGSWFRMTAKLSPGR
jgi:hypothetical protein